MTPKDVLKMAKEKGVKIIDLRFIDLPGLWQHFSIPVSELSEGIFEDGLGFDGSSIRGFQTIDESDMLLIPDPTHGPDGSVHRGADAGPDLQRQGSGHRQGVHAATPATSPRRPRRTSRRAAWPTRSSSAPSWSSSSSTRSASTRTTTPATTSSTRRRAPGTRGKEGTPDQPEPRLQAALQAGLLPGAADGPVPGHPVGHGAGPGVGRRARRGAPPRGGHRRPDRDRHALRHADEDGRQGALVQVLREEHRARSGARPPPSCPSRCSRTTAPACTPTSRCGRTARTSSTSGAATPTSAKMCLYYIGGILKHAPALLALIAPSTNSYKRLVPGYEAPINLVYSQRNRSAAIRIPMYSKSEGAKRIEFRTPDPTCNPYLSFAACVMAGLDGIANKIDPGKPVDKDLYELPPAEQKKIKQLPGDLVDRARQPREEPRLAAQGRRVHARRHRDVDRVQAEERGRRGAAAAASVGVRAVLRYLKVGGSAAAPALRVGGSGAAPDTPQR